MASPKKRSLNALEDEGWTVRDAEFHLKRYITVDFLGFADLIALRPPGSPMLVQVTSDDTGGHFQDRIRKVLSSELARLWLDSRCRIQVHEWSQRGPRGKPKEWTCRAVEVLLDLDGTTMTAREIPA